MVYRLLMLVHTPARRAFGLCLLASFAVGISLQTGCGSDSEQASPSSKADAAGTDAAPEDGNDSDAALDSNLPETSSELVTVTPTESEELFANPGMGWQTFHSYADTDKNLAGLPSGSAYARFIWRELEPTDGTFDFSGITEAISHARSQGQTFMFRVMTAGDTSEYSPDWLNAAGCKVLAYDSGGGVVHAPDLDDPSCRARHDKLITELGKALASEHDIQVDIGSVGLWGEWHFSGTNPKIEVPSLETRKSVVDLYFQVFPDVPKLALIGDVDALAYATGKGAGWRADCLGDMGFFSPTWNHMNDMYKQHVAQAGANDAWKTAPVAWESCYTMAEWIQAGYDAHQIFQFALDMHGSFVNNKSAALPAGDAHRAEVEWLISRMGYRLALRSLTHPKSLGTSGKLILSMDWENLGVAPPYADYRLAIRLSSPGAKDVILKLATSLRSWLPGPVHVSDSLDYGALPAGTWQLSVGVLREDKPDIKLAITGRDTSGWYPLSELRIE